MRLRNLLVLLALTVAVGISSCGKKAEEAAPADSSAMTPAPAAPAATEPAPAAAPADTAALGGAK